MQASVNASKPSAVASVANSRSRDIVGQCCIAEIESVKGERPIEQSGRCQSEEASNERGLTCDVVLR
jgi:hypothetical protein